MLLSTNAFLHFKDGLVSNRLIIDHNLPDHIDITFHAILHSRTIQHAPDTKLEYKVSKWL